MAEESLGSLFVELGLDSSEFTKSMKDVDQRMKLAKSEFAAAGGKVKDFDKTQEGAKARTAMLSDQIKLQKAKLELLNNEYEEAVKGGDKTAKKATDLKIKMNEATGEIKKLEEQLKDGTQELDDFGNEAKDTTDKTNKFGDAMSGLGRGMGVIGGAVGTAAVATVAAIAAAAVAGAKALFDMASNVGDLADELLTQSAQTNVSAETLQEWGYAARFLDTDVETMTKGLSKIVKATGEAAESNKKYIEIAKGIKVPIRDANGELLSSEEIFYKSIDALGQMTNSTEQEIAAQELFGESYQDMLPLIKAGGDSLAALSDEAHEMGAVLSDEALAAAGEFDDGLERLDAAADGLKNTLGIAAIPAIETFTDAMTDVIPEITNAISTGDWSGATEVIGETIADLVGKAVEMLPGLFDMAQTIIGDVVEIVAELVPEVLPALIDAAISLIDTLINIIVENGPQLIDTATDAAMRLIEGLLDALPEIIEVGIQMLVALIEGIAEALPELVPAALDAVLSLVTALTDNLPLIVDAAVQIIIALVRGLADALPELIPAAVDAVLTLVMALIDNLPLIIDAAIQLILGLVDGLIAALPEILEAAPEIIQALVDGLIEADGMLLDAAIDIIVALVEALIENYPMFLQSGYEIIGTLIGGMIESFSQLWEFAPKLFEELWEALKSIKWGELGTNIITGIVDGIKGAASSVWGAITDVIGGGYDAAEDEGEMHSPSERSRREIGQQWGAGVVLGVEDMAQKVNAAMARLSGNYSTQVNFTANGGTSNKKIEVGGTIRVEGVDNEGQTKAIVEVAMEQIMDRLEWEARMA